MNDMTVFEELKWRGLVNDVTGQETIDAINKGGLKFYIGVDPTGDSLHIGHYSTVIATAKRLMDAGHTPIIIAGGGTGLIGDPKPNVERPMISKEAVKHNIECIQKQVSKILGGDIQIVNNADWLLKMDAVDYLRDYGKHFNVNYMLAKDTVKRRLDVGITYTEFSYMILQSIDFLKLYENYGVTMQVGGQDQWGNITAGLELIRKIHGDVSCHGFTVPLVTRSDGTKFGKSESGQALWLDKDKTSPYELYQYLVNSEDSKVIDYLKKLTFLSVEDIMKLEESVKTEPEKREAGKTLAYEVVKFIHGEEEARIAKETSEEVFSGKSSDNMPTVSVSESEYNILDLLILLEMVPSKSEARRVVLQGGIKINGERQDDANFVVEIDDTIVQKGKKVFVKVVKD
jgi:tyrosyl-tRNA synthetase